MEKLATFIPKDSEEGVLAFLERLQTCLGSSTSEMETLNLGEGLISFKTLKKIREDCPSLKSLQTNPALGDMLLRQLQKIVEKDIFDLSEEEVSSAVDGFECTLPVTDILDVLKTQLTFDPKNMAFLDLSECSLDLSSLEEILAHFPGLIGLTVDVENLQMLEKLPASLRYLGIFKGDLRNSDFSHLKKLEGLCLNFYVKVDRALIQKLPATLRYLDIWAGDLAGADFSKFKDLRTLYIGTEVENVDMDSIRAALKKGCIINKIGQTWALE